jgi:toxin HigB-1
LEPDGRANVRRATSKVSFRTRKLQRAYEESDRAIRAYGPEVGRRYIQRINVIKAARSVEDLKVQRPLRCHELQGKRAGQWAINLTDRYRLIFTISDLEFDVVRVEEVTKHYGD